MAEELTCTPSRFLMASIAQQFTANLSVLTLARVVDAICSLEGARVGTLILIEGISFRADFVHVGDTNPFAFF
ncbi:hypothetical protein Rcae01_05938 [Novipirellula caenicola]|uniref:Uncharacterized protein n=1 Tax=Novipirellula caenicola TaxID=1536901 RepID=A0ABP9W0V7_9BACT